MSDSVKKYFEMVEEGTIKPNTKETGPWIYESPDGGKTVRKRKMQEDLNVDKGYSELELTETIINIVTKFKGASPALVLQLAKDELSVKRVCN